MTFRMAAERLEMTCNRRSCVFNFNNVDSKAKYKEGKTSNFYRF